MVQLTVRRGKAQGTIMGDPKTPVTAGSPNLSYFSTDHNHPAVDDAFRGTKTRVVPPFLFHVYTTVVTVAPPVGNTLANATVRRVVTVNDLSDAVNSGELEQPKTSSHCRRPLRPSAA